MENEWKRALLSFFLFSSLSDVNQRILIEMEEKIDTRWLLFKNIEICFEDEEKETNEWLSVLFQMISAVRETVINLRTTWNNTRWIDH